MIVASITATAISHLLEGALCTGGAELWEGAAAIAAKRSPGFLRGPVDPYASLPSRPEVSGALALQTAHESQVMQANSSTRRNTKRWAGTPTSLPHFRGNEAAF